MPVEIREINIKATINQGKKPGISKRPGKDSSLDKEAIIAECIERIMELMKLNQER